METNRFIVNQKEMGQRLKKLRERKGISIEKLAEEMMVSPNAIYKWHRGDSAPDIQNIATLSSIYNVSTDYILLGIRGDDREASPLPVYIELLSA